MQPAQPYQPPMAMPPQTAAPYGVPMGPMPYGYVPMTAPRYGPFLVLMGTLMIGIGAIILAFALGSVGFGNQQTSGTFPNYTFSISVFSTGFTIGTLLVGVGIILRGLGGFMTKPS